MQIKLYCENEETVASFDTIGMIQLQMGEYKVLLLLETKRGPCLLFPPGTPFFVFPIPTRKHILFLKNI